jgi:hypothetical protein
MIRILRGWHLTVYLHTPKVLIFCDPRYPSLDSSAHLAP